MSGSGKLHSAIIAASLAGLLALLVPLQSFVGNSSLYAYSLSRLLFELLPLSLLLALALFALLRLTGRWLGVFPHALIVAATVCVYLESGFLSAGLPEIDGGAMPELDSLARGLADAAVWAVVIVGFLVAARKLVGWFHWISAAVLLLGAVSLLDVRRDGAAVSEPTEGKVGCLAGGVRVNQMTVVANIRYSPVRNVLVFVLDSMPGTVATDVAKSDPALQEKFSGFTAYPQNIGMADCTKRGVPGIVTGRYYDPDEMPQAEYPLTMYGTNSFLKTYCDAGWHVAFSPDLLPYGFTTLPVEREVARDDRRSRDALAILHRSKEVPYLCLFDLVAFRVAPFFFKGPIVYSKIRHAVKGRHSDGEFWGERNMYPTLAAAPANADPRPFLGFFHSWGAHPPWAKDQRTTVRDKLTRLGALMDVYRARGLYDRSLIVVTTDHGNGTAPALDGYPPQASALLWVKPEGADGAFAFSDLKTSHAKICELVKASCGRRLTQDEVVRTLRTENRIYRREEGRNNFKDYGERK